MTIFSILFAILIFAVVILLHELGHFVAAKLSGVQVNEFALFMGPAIFKKKIGETLYSIRCVPIGGYCAMEGEDTDTDNPRSFQKAAWWKRLIILVSGSGMNFVTGFILLLFVFSFSVGYAVPVIAQAEPGCTVVSEDGFHVGDRIVSIDGYRTFTSADASLLFAYGGETYDIVLDRNGQTVTLEDFTMEKHLFPNEEAERYGFSFGVEEPSFFNLISYTFHSCLSVVQSVWLSLKFMVTGQVGISEITGPVGIVQMMSTTAASSDSMLTAILNMLYFGGFIAINLGVMNLLPIPALDGGRSVGLLLTTAFEKIFRRKLNPKIEAYIHAGGMILLLILMAVIMFKDIIFIFI